MKFYFLLTCLFCTIINCSSEEKKEDIEQGLPGSYAKSWENKYKAIALPGEPLIQKKTRDSIHIKKVKDGVYEVIETKWVDIEGDKEGFMENSENTLKREIWKWNDKEGVIEHPFYGTISLDLSKGLLYVNYDSSFAFQKVK